MKRYKKEVSKLFTCFSVPKTFQAKLLIGHT